MSPASWIRRRPLAAFFLLAFGVSWSFWLAALVLYPSSLPAADRAPAQVLGVAGTFGPFAAAVVVARVTGTWAELRRRLLRWRVAPRWYLVALGLPAVAVAAAYLAYRLLGGAPMDLGRAFPVAALVPVFVFTLLAGGGNEEPGWRGFALPRLQDRFGALAGTLVLAVLWAGWHLPAFLDPASSQSLVPPGAWALGVVAASLVLTWLFNATGGSVPVAAVFHATFNVAALWVVSGLPAGAVGSFYWTGIAVYLVVAGVLVLATRAHLGAVRRPQETSVAGK